MKRRTIIATAILFILIVGCNHSSAQSAEELLPKAIQLEEVKGELEEAIEVYKTIVNDYPANRSVAAKAYFHLGMCYEKLGKEEAQNAYNTVVRNYADQEEVVNEAKARLVALRQTRISVSESDGLTLRRVWSSAEDTYGVSPSGRYLNYIDWDAIALAVKDLQTGKTWKITHTGTWEGSSKFPDHSIWSPDSKQLAYFWFNEDITELHIINFDGSGDRIICDGKGLQTPFPIDWSADGKHILALKSSGNENNPEGIVDQIVLVAAVDGSIQVLESLEEVQSGCCGSFSPDNQYIAYAIQQEEGSEQNDIFVLALDGSYNERVVSDPADDKNVLWSPDGSSIVFRSDRTGTNDIWTLQLNNGVPVGEPELVKSNIGRGKLLGITDDESLFYDYSNSRRDVFIAKLDFNSGEVLSKLKKISSLEEEGSIKPAWSPDGRYVAFLTGSSVADQVLGHRIRFVIHDTETDSYRNLVTDLYGNPMGFFMQQWSPDGKFLLVHGRTDEDKLQGFFLVDIETGERTSILVKEREHKHNGQLFGIFPKFTWDGKSILYYSEDKKTIFKKDIAGKKEEKIFYSKDPIRQFRVSPDGTQIVFVYRHDNPNSNMLYSMPFSGGEIKKLAEFHDDVIPYMISWAPDHEHEIIVMANIYGESPEIFRVPVKGGDPERIFILDELLSQGKLRHIAMSPGSHQIAVELETGAGHEIWAMKNLFKK